MVCYLAVKKEQVKIDTAAWINLRCILLSERNKIQKATYCVVAFICHSIGSKAIWQWETDQWLGKGFTAESAQGHVFGVGELFCDCCGGSFFIFYLSFIYLFILRYNIVLILPYIDMNQPWVYMCFPS